MAIRTPLTNIEEYLDNHGVNPRELPRRLDVLVSYIDKLEKRIESLEGDHCDKLEVTEIFKLEDLVVSKEENENIRIAQVIAIDKEKPGKMEITYGSDTIYIVNTENYRKANGYDLIDTVTDSSILLAFLMRYYMEKEVANSC